MKKNGLTDVNILDRNEWRMAVARATHRCGRALKVKKHQVFLIPTSQGQGSVIVLSRVPPLTFPSLPCSLSHSLSHHLLPPLTLSLAPLLPPSSLLPSSASFLPPVSTSPSPCPVPSLPRSFTPQLASSLPSLSHPVLVPFRPFLAPSFLS